MLYCSVELFKIRYGAAGQCKSWRRFENTMCWNIVVSIKDLFVCLSISKSPYLGTIYFATNFHCKQNCGIDSRFKTLHVIRVMIILSPKSSFKNTLKCKLCINWVYQYFMYPKSYNLTLLDPVKLGIVIYTGYLIRVGFPIHFATP